MQKQIKIAKEPTCLLKYARVNWNGGCRTIAAEHKKTGCFGETWQFRYLSHYKAVIRLYFCLSPKLFIYWLKNICAKPKDMKNNTGISSEYREGGTGWGRGRGESGNKLTA